MIYIQRQTAPQFFVEIALRRQQIELLHAWLNTPAAERPAPPALAPRYATIPAVAEQIVQEFLGKCAFCEQQLPSEQQKLIFFRPLGQALQKPEKNGGQPDPHHYAWLIGDWSNLYLACEICRNKHGAEFPTGGERITPDISHLARANALPYFVSEQPQIIDPCVEAPAHHLAFTERGLAVPREGSPIGQKTIAIFDLNRRSLQEMRATEAQQFKTLWQQAYALTCRGESGETNRLAELFAQLLAACAPTAQFAGMKRHLLLEWIDHEKNAAETPQPVITALNGTAWQGLAAQIQKLLYPANALLRLDRDNTFLLTELIGLYTSATPHPDTPQLQVMVIANQSEIVMGDKVVGDKVAGNKFTVGNLKGSQVTVG